MKMRTEDQERYALAFEHFVAFSRAVSEVHKDSVPAANVTFSFLPHNGNFYVSVVTWGKNSAGKGGKKKVICKYEHRDPVMAVLGCIEEFLKDKAPLTAVAKLRAIY